MLALFRMTDNSRDRAALKGEPYRWNIDAFCRPNQRLESIISRNRLLPQLVLSQERCIQPKGFVENMRY